MKIFYLLLLGCIMLSCKNDKEAKSKTELEVSQHNDSITNERSYAVLDSKLLNSNAMWSPFELDLATFSDSDYDRVKALVFEKDIPIIQQAIVNDDLSYEDLVLFYLRRIKKYDRNNNLSLNSIISLNPSAIEQARTLDKLNKDVDVYSLYGMPVLLKDNINTAEMPTTAGAEIFKTNTTDDAFITKKLKESGAIILGKANLSEWAYFFCGDCPSRYSAIGGQTLNPYGRKIHDTGGSSSGSGVAMAANFAVAAIGTETSGSILSPSSSNSVVGLKPTVGLLSRSGIVPISSTLDTPGPMTRSVIDNAIVLQALLGEDRADAASINLNASPVNYVSNLNNLDDAKSLVKDKRLGYYASYIEDDSLYQEAIQILRDAGAQLVEIKRSEVDLPQFLRVLNLDMQKDLPKYIAQYGAKNLKVKDLQEITQYNKLDSVLRMPYGQRLFYGVLSDSASSDEFTAIKDTLRQNGKQFFDEPMQANNLDAVLSINNYMAGYAAVAHYPALTVPMGYKDDNQPMGLTLIAPSLSESLLLQIGYAYESLSRKRKTPTHYNN